VKVDLWNFWEDKLGKENDSSFVNTKAGSPVPRYLNWGSNEVRGLMAGAWLAQEYGKSKGRLRIV
jgi:hypothetical protein